MLNLWLHFHGQGCPSPVWISSLEQSHLVRRANPASLRSVTPNPPCVVGRQTVAQATRHFPRTEQSWPAQKNFRRILSISSIAQAGSCSAIIVYVGIVERTVGSNRARRWTPTQQPPENSTRLRRGHDRRPSRRRAEHLVATATTAKQAILHYN
jgi:hypothetical protein